MHISCEARSTLQRQWFTGCTPATLSMHVCTYHTQRDKSSRSFNKRCIQNWIRIRTIKRAGWHVIQWKEPCARPWHTCQAQHDMFSNVWLTLKNVHGLCTNVECTVRHLSCNIPRAFAAYCYSGMVESVPTARPGRRYWSSSFANADEQRLRTVLVAQSVRQTRWNRTVASLTRKNLICFAT